MKKAASTSRMDLEDDLLPEYKLDYRKAQPNRFAARLNTEGLEVVLDPDVSEVFTNPESVNAVLRALIATMPRPPRSRKITRKKNEG